MKTLQIDFDEIQKAMEDTSREAFDYFLDLETGEVIVLSEEIIGKAREILGQDQDDDTEPGDEMAIDDELDIPEWIDEEIELCLDIFLREPSRYARIPERSTQQAFGAMRDFAASLDDEDLREDLEAALNGRNAFRRFKDVLGPFPQERKEWYGFNAKASRKEIGEWLLTIGVNPDAA